MKTSQKSLLSVLGAMLAIILLILASGRVAVSNADIDVYEPKERYSVAPELTGFDKVDISGNWEIALMQGDGWNVELSSADNTKGRVEVYVSDGELHLQHRSSFGLWGASTHPSATIQMPNLSELDLSGASEVTLAGFSGESLAVDASGAVEIAAENGRYTDLFVDGSGAIEIQFKKLTVTNADIEMAGASELVLTMDGGDLTGSISGAGSVDYYGQVSVQDIDVAGAASIDNRQ